MAQVSSETQYRNDSESLTKTDNDESVKTRLQQSKTLPRILWHWATVSILFVAALCFNLYHLGTPSIWYDEAFSVELARQPLPLLWYIIFGPEPNMELYYLFLHYWLNLTSLIGLHATEFVVRFPSAIFAALSTLVVFAIGQRFLGTLIGTLGAVLYLLNDIQLTYAQQTRSYALQLLLICVAWYALFAVLDSEKQARRWWIIYVVSWVLAVYAHLFSLLILLSQLIAVGGILLLPNRWRNRSRKQFVSLLISLGSIFLLIIPMLIESRHGSKTGWLPTPHWHDIYHLFDTISGYNQQYLYSLIAFCGLGLLAIAIAYFAQLFPPLQNSSSATSSIDETFTSFGHLVPVVWSLFCWLVIPIGVSYILSHGSLRLFSARYLVTIVPPLFLLVAFGVMALRLRIVQGYFATILVVLALLAVPMYYKSAQVEDWNSTTHWLLQHYQSGDGLVCYDNNQGCQISVEYYLHAYPNGAHFTDDSPGAFSWVNYGPVNPKSGYKAALDPKALAAYAKKHARFFYIAGRISTDQDVARVRSTEHWLDGHYHLVDQIVKTTVTIRLYTTH
ncbi:MAG TPA: glycosyltransferase family 39 protein [Ktedonobacteraceae bacterium]|nr:glycosyltransferase family 39 protein [Ktedonobacteraceae bacterium]